MPLWVVAAGQANEIYIPHNDKRVPSSPSPSQQGQDEGAWKQQQQQQQQGLQQQLLMQQSLQHDPPVTSAATRVNAAYDWVLLASGLPTVSTLSGCMYHESPRMLCSSSSSSSSQSNADRNFEEGAEEGWGCAEASKGGCNALQGGRLRESAGNGGLQMLTKRAKKEVGVCFGPWIGAVFVHKNWQQCSMAKIEVERMRRRVQESISKVKDRIRRLFGRGKRSNAQQAANEDEGRTTNGLQCEEAAASR
eukprot:1152981-Pelagomonas_calceolata.AAC.11